ncbi:MAG TPA: DUF2252 family protein [Tepidisphaeraceae bacterium]
MDMRAATRQFEQWLGDQVPIVRGDLRHKHLMMRADVFSFMRATYYRWVQQFPLLDSNVSKAPKVLAVGDLHVENFGTWRDKLGRLAWGINDFDEAFPLPYAHDLVRLALSTLLAIEQDHLVIRAKVACRTILEGYRDGLNIGGRPFVIGDEHLWLRPILNEPPRDPGRFWDQLRSLPLEREKIPKHARSAIVRMMPDSKLACTVHHRVAGLGSLGKPRYTAVAEWEGGPLAREAKALTLSANAWLQKSHKGPYYTRILKGAARAADPFLAAHGAWVTRRLAPDCRRIELSSFRRIDEEEFMLHAMGYETANVHLGTAGARHRILSHLNRQSKGWLRNAALKMHSLLMKDFGAQ